MTSAICKLYDAAEQCLTAGSVSTMLNVGLRLFDLIIS